jgi:predicted DNA-binding protein with PD1-like motif
VNFTGNVLVFAPGDEVIETLRQFASEHVTTSAFFHAIGAFSSATVAFWNPATKEYEDIAVDEQVEVLSIAGNLTRIDTGFKVHAHAVLGHRDGSTVGGHVKRGVVYPTLEMIVTLTHDAIHRERDDATGLDLIVMR